MLAILSIVGSSITKLSKIDERTQYDMSAFQSSTKICTPNLKASLGTLLLRLRPFYLVVNKTVLDFRNLLRCSLVYVSL